MYLIYLRKARSHHNCAIIQLIRLAIRNVDILIESTRGFEKDLAKLSEDEKAAAIARVDGFQARNHFQQG
jgi:hypothetical protein